MSHSREKAFPNSPLWQCGSPRPRFLWVLQTGHCGHLAWSKTTASTPKWIQIPDKKIFKRTCLRLQFGSSSHITEHCPWSTDLKYHNRTWASKSAGSLPFQTLLLKQMSYGKPSSERIRLKCYLLVAERIQDSWTDFFNTVNNGSVPDPSLVGF